MVCESCDPQNVLAKGLADKGTLLCWNLKFSTSTSTPIAILASIQKN